jgi:hypothetical protein
MARKPNHFTPDLELDKFDTNDAGETVVRTTATGEFSPTGLKNGQRITTLSVGTTATALPATPLAERNAIAIYNKSATEILYVGNSDVTADTVIGTTSGWEIDPLSYYQLDVTGNIVIYGRYASGSELIKVKEIS